ncbi:MAG: hypothetical protein IMY87_02525 [Chloroflexi bacterium]|nr:hypothetical protein [Chloroflexota bacterium]
MAEVLKPARGGFLRPFGCGEFIWKFLLGHGPHGSSVIDPYVGAAQADIFRHYKVALMKAAAVDRTTRTEEEMAKRQKRRIDPENIERLTQRYLDGMPYKAQGCRFHNFIVYFSTLQRLGWVKLQAKKSRQPFRTITRPVRRAVISVSQTLAELLLRQPGLIHIAPFMANIRLTGRKADNNYFQLMKCKENQGGSLVQLAFI